MIAGLVVGSFLNVCISRLPEERSIIFPPSHCPKCGKELKAYDLIPVLSYLLLGGRCRACGKRISLRYPIVEALTAVLFLAFYFKLGISAGYFLSILFASILIVISFIDIEHMFIHDILVLSGIAAGVLYSALNASLAGSLQGICFGFLFMFLVGYGAKYMFKKEALGDGDIKLMVMLGSFIGMERSLWAITIASIAGSIIGITLILFGRIKRQDYIPFAPFLAMGALISIFI